MNSSINGLGIFSMALGLFIMFYGKKETGHFFILQGYLFMIIAKLDTNDD